MKNYLREFQCINIYILLNGQNGSPFFDVTQKIAKFFVSGFKHISGLKLVYLSFDEKKGNI